MLTNDSFAVPCRSVLLVEPRDEIFARLAGELEGRGLCVFRATSAAGASRSYARRPVDLLLVPPALPDESGWLFLSKLRLTDPAAKVWVYTAHVSPAEVDLANFVRADELIDYGGALWRLTEEVLDRLDEPAAVDSSAPWGGPLAVA